MRLYEILVDPQSRGSAKKYFVESPNQRDALIKLRNALGELNPDFAISIVSSNARIIK